MDEFDGHTTDYYIDGVPSSEKEYTAALLSYGGGAEKMKTLTMPAYFAEEVPWEARRQILLELCGDISDADIISDTPELASLQGYLLKLGAADQHHAVDEYRKIATAKKAEINRELQGIPSRIDEATRAMPDIAGIDKGGLDRKIKEGDASYARYCRARQGRLGSQNQRAR
ncbi:MAG: hypothetical protein DDT37_02007 [Firmicutes bacterium]|nr:hypothetical protein [candidate division NPL-UPA2 bacterium]